MNEPWIIREWLLYPFKYFSSTAEPACQHLNLRDASIIDLNQKLILEEHWQSVNKTGNSPADVVFSFETIEHIPSTSHVNYVNSLLDNSNRYVIIGSVNRTGPRYIDGVEIWKKEYGTHLTHELEYSTSEWQQFFMQHFIGYQHITFGCRYSELNRNFYMAPGSENYSISNYAILFKDF